MCIATAGGCTKEIKSLQAEGIVNTFMFRYENKNSKIKKAAMPSQVGWGDLNSCTWDDLLWTWDDFSGSDKYGAILKIVGGRNNRIDALHLDSAYKSNCKIFVTSDKDDIWKHRVELLRLLGITVFHTSEMEKLILMIKGVTMNSQNNKFRNFIVLCEKYSKMSDEDAVENFIEAESTIDYLECCINNNETNIPRKVEIGAACFYLWMALSHELRTEEDLQLIENLLEPEKGVAIFSAFPRIKKIREDAIASLNLRGSPTFRGPDSSVFLNMNDIVF